MTQSFDEWLESMGYMDGYQHHYEDAYDTGYEAGQKSRQAEIDEYKEVAESMEDLYIRSNKREQELRKRIDEALEGLEYPTATWEETVFCVVKILKGTTNEQ